MGRWRDAERANKGSGKSLFLYLDINCKNRWAYSSGNYINNLTKYTILANTNNNNNNKTQILAENWYATNIVHPYFKVPKYCLQHLHYIICSQTIALHEDLQRCTQSHVN